MENKNGGWDAQTGFVSPIIFTLEEALASGLSVSGLSVKNLCENKEMKFTMFGVNSESFKYSVKGHTFTDKDTEGEGHGKCDYEYKVYTDPLDSSKTDKIPCGKLEYAECHTHAYEAGSNNLCKHCNRAKKNLCHTNRE